MKNLRYKVHKFITNSKNKELMKIMQKFNQNRKKNMANFKIVKNLLMMQEYLIQKLI
jgi:hypothetical protein